MANRGKIVILSGPSGSGKGTIVKEFISRRAGQTVLSVSATTRAPRAEDVEGVTYYFFSREQFINTVDNGGMLEYTEYCGNLYGTPKAYVDAVVSQGKDVILEIEVCGAFNVKKLCSDAYLVFVMAPSAQVLKERLVGRGSETEETVRKRLQTAVGEIALAGIYDYILVNDDLSVAVDELERAIDGRLNNVKDMVEFIKGVENDVKTFNQ